MDNRVFNVNGKDDAMLIKALALAFEQCSSQCKAWKVTENGLVLSWDTNNMNPFPTPLSAAQVSPLVISWLKSKEALSTNLHEGEDDPNDSDISTELGWRVFIEPGISVSSNYGTICCVKPVYLWYGK